MLSLGNMTKAISHSMELQIGIDSQAYVGKGSPTLIFSKGVASWRRHGGRIEFCFPLH